MNVLVKTKFEYDSLMEMLEHEGFSWYTGTFPTERDEWEEYKEETVIFINTERRDFSYADKAYAKYSSEPYISFPNPTYSTLVDKWEEEVVNVEYRLFAPKCGYLYIDKSGNIMISTGQKTSDWKTRFTSEEIEELPRWCWFLEKERV